MFIFNENTKFVVSGTFTSADPDTDVTGKETVRASIANRETAMHDARRVFDERVNQWLTQSKEYRNCGCFTWFEVTLSVESEFGSPITLAYYDLVG